MTQDWEQQADEQQRTNTGATEQLGLRQQLEAARREIAWLEDELAAATQRATNLFEHGGDALFIIDRATGHILEANGQAVRHTGYTQEELQRLCLVDLELCGEEQALRAGRARRYECHYRRKDGRLWPVEVNTRAVRLGKREVLQHSVRSIGARKQGEREREQLIADLDSFAHTVAHDLKNPLAVIVTYAYLFEDSWQDLSDEDRQNYVQAMAENSQRAMNIVDELLLLAKVRQIEEIERMSLAMGSIAEEAVDRLTHLIQREDAQVHLPAVWETALGYAPWVREMWVNYISNAIKYGGQPAKIELGSTHEGTHVRYWVRDNGAGIAAEDLPHLFNEFNRLGKLKIEGYGLGLSIVQRIARKLGGDVAVESTPGQGSIFSFTLPIVPKC